MKIEREIDSNITINDFNEMQAEFWNLLEPIIEAEIGGEDQVEDKYNTTYYTRKSVLENYLTKGLQWTCSQETFDSLLLPIIYGLGLKQYSTPGLKFLGYLVCINDDVDNIIFGTEEKIKTIPIKQVVEEPIDTRFDILDL